MYKYRVDGDRLGINWRNFISDFKPCTLQLDLVETTKCEVKDLATWVYSHSKIYPEATSVYHLADAASRMQNLQPLFKASVTRLAKVTKLISELSSNSFLHRKKPSNHFVYFTWRLNSYMPNSLPIPFHYNVSKVNVQIY